MPFVNEEELKNRNKLVKDYINNRKLLKQKLQNEIVAKQQLQKSASEVFRPITKTFEETQKKTDKRQDQLIQHIQQQLAIEDKPRSIYTVHFESAFDNEEKELLTQNNFETDIVELVKRGPDYINALKDRARLINQSLGGLRRRRDADTEVIDKQIKTFKKYREKLNKLLGGMELTFGKGLKDPNKLCERLNLLVAAKQAGNNNKRLDQEIAKILKKLKLNKCISHCDHQKLFDNILK